MLSRIFDRFKFLLERWIQRGVLHQLLLMVTLIVLVAISGGLVVWVASESFSNPGAAIWWAFLRLTDPGYLGDDEGTLLRTVSTVVTVLGYVLFMGSLIAILTQWLNGTMRELESGHTPIAINDHILILGWTNRTPAIVQELMLSEGRVRRFLRRKGARSLRIVILAEEVDADLRLELRNELGERWDERQVIFRSGVSLRVEHLRRVDFANAVVVIIPGADFSLGGAEATDARVIKTLLSLSSHGHMERSTNPPVVAEIFDAQKIAIAQRAYGGTTDALASDSFISRLIAQNVRHRGLSYVYGELISHTQGNEVYVRSCPECVGRTMHELGDVFPSAILLGAIRPEGNYFHPILNPPPDFRLGDEDRLVVIAQSYNDSLPSPKRLGISSPLEVSMRAEVPVQSQRRVLFMGWSHMVAALIREFSGYPNEQFEIDVLSLVDADEREKRLARHDLDLARVQLRQLEGDYTNATELLRIDPASYDNIVFLGSDWMDTEEESDARTILGFVLLRSLLADAPAPPEILVELMDPENARLFRQRAGEVIISPRILSHMLAHVALRRELSAVFGELFGPGGAEIFFRPAGDYEAVGRIQSFRELQHAAAQRGEIALGVRLHAERDNATGGVVLNPPKGHQWRLTREDEIVVLTTYV